MDCPECRLRGDALRECEKHLMERKSREIRNLLLNVFRETNQEKSELSHSGPETGHEVTIPRKEEIYEIISVKRSSPGENK
jgi:hypothetical protein